MSGRIVGRHGARVPLVVGGLGLDGGSLPSRSHPGWWICVACGLVVVVMAFVSTTERALNTARLLEATTA